LTEENLSAIAKEALKELCNMKTIEPFKELKYD